jgi:uncharacterized protein YdeI (YjbR/CyaY-like superfamily)
VRAFRGKMVAGERVVAGLDVDVDPSTVGGIVNPIFFRSPSEFRAWLAEHHDRESELLVGFLKKGTGEPSMSWPESVDEALCFGWIDGVRKRIDDRSYSIRFSPRRTRSVWSKVNIERAEALIREGRMQPAGLAAYEARRENRVGVHSYEQRRPRLEEPYQEMLRQDGAAWAFFDAQPPSYRKAMSWWIVSAKREATRLRRLEKLREFSARGLRVPEFTLEKPPR